MGERGPTGDDGSAMAHHSDALDELNETQRRVHRILASAGNPLTAYEVLDRMRAEGAVTPPTVYRSLDRLIGKGLAHRLESLNAYVACAQPHEGHHHGHSAAFAICERCGLVKEFCDEGLNERLEDWSDGHAFSPRKITVEIRGFCPDCAK